MANYTYINFANDVINMANGNMDEINLDNVIEKANALIARESNKATYNASKPRKSTPKALKESTIEGIDKVSKALTNDFQTGAELNEKMGTNYTALQLSNFIRLIDRVESTKVKRETLDGKGLKGEKLYTGYRFTA